MEGYSSDEGPTTIAFSQAKIEAIKSLKQAAANARSAKDLKKKKQQEHLKKMKMQRETKLKVKKLPDDVLENLSAVPIRTRRKLPEKQPTTKKKSLAKEQRKNVKKSSEKDSNVTNTKGCTTRFQVMDLKKLKTGEFQEERLASYRQKMLARNPRQPVSSYLMCLRKRKAAGKEKINS